LSKQGTHAENQKVAAGLLGISSNAMHSSNTRIFQELIQDLKLVTDYYPVFEGRCLDNEQEVRELLLKLNRQIRDSVTEKTGKRELR